MIGTKIMDGVVYTVRADRWGEEMTVEIKAFRIEDGGTYESLYVIDSCPMMDAIKKIPSDCIMSDNQRQMAKQAFAKLLGY